MVQVRHPGRYRRCFVVQCEVEKGARREKRCCIAKRVDMPSVVSVRCVKPLHEGGKKMAEVVAKLGVKRESGYLYFLRGSDVWKTPMKRAGGPSAAGKAEKVAS